MKKALTTAALAATIGMGALALTATSASAYIACNSAGDCWHVHDQYAYPSNVGIVVHEDNWKWDEAPTDTTVHYRWHEHEGRGYWRDGVWITF
ncbi:MAG TPA: hypothetical protein VGG48_00285 [Rhizomicrobium sp.]|jgi:hypothetical protein